MKRIKHAKVLSMLCMTVLLVLNLPLMSIAWAAEYEPLEVKLAYTHRYTTTDESADSVFHYTVKPNEDAPLPAEADANGVFSYKGATGSGEKKDDKTVFLNTGTLTFTFTSPGVYSYELSANLDIDNKKDKVERYHFDPRKYTVYFYIVNAEEGGMKLEMLTAEDDHDVKPNEVIFDPSYKDPDQPKPEPEPEPETPDEPDTPVQPDKPDTPVKPAKPSKGGKIVRHSSGKSGKSGNPKTGDDTNVIPYILLMLGSGAAIVFIIGRRKKGSEDDNA